MCRLIGQIISSSEIPDVKHFKRLTELSVSGGPDNTSYFIEGTILFGFNRLSILDLSSNGNQPIKTPSGRYVLMMNGEIYNFKSLISDFNLKNLRSTSDAEVVCHLVDIMGMEKTITLLNGMFAISCWDTLNEVLWLARDFAGIKPLYYSFSDKGLLFASQFDQIFKHNWFQSFSWNINGLQTYFRVGFMKSPHTIIENINSLEPGEIICYEKKNDRLKKNFYKQYFKKVKECKLKAKDSNTIELVHSVFKKVISDQLISDVPVGVFLSGGIDSALVASVSSKFNPNIETLTVGFEDKKYDESTFANSYAKELKIRNKNILISASLAAEIIKKHNEKLSEPLADFSSLPMYFACNVANTRYKVMLSGDGGDEMFWGYPRYQWLNKSRYLLKIPSENLRRKIAGLFFEANEVSKFKLSSNTIGEANMKASQISTKKQIQSLFKIKDGSLDELRELFDFDSVKQLKILKYFQENDFYCFMQKVLIKVDRASMANSLEVRVPFLDERILQVVEQINPILGNSGEELKYISKQILFKYIDPSLIQKSKMGFTPPINQWIVDTLKEEINDIVNSKYCLNISMDYSFLRSYWISVKNNSNSDFNLIWSYYILFKFLERMQKLNVNG